MEQNFLRLNKFLALAGVASRRNADTLIKQGRVDVNGKTVDKLDTLVRQGVDKVTLDGEPVKLRALVYYLLHKPKGCVTTTSDEKGRRTVMDLIPGKERIFPVGRLDFNTTGVLLLTNDGDFTNSMLHPSNKIQREYEAKLDRPLTRDDEKVLLKGVFIDKVRGKFEKVKAVSDDRKVINVIALEGRNHFVKKMFAKLGYTVTSLARVRFGQFTVKGIPMGAYRPLSPEEITGVFEQYGK